MDAFKKKKGSSDVAWEESGRQEIPEITEEDRDTIMKKMAALDKVLAAKKQAKYKLELFLGKARSMTIPVPGCVSFWESGTKLHGGGDCKIYFCPGKMLKKNNCESPIPSAFNGLGHLVCPTCKEVWKGPQVIGEVFGRHNMRQWAELLHIYFLRLNYNCDIYMKCSPDDIRNVALLEQERQRGGELLDKARMREKHVYPLRNIIKDTSVGADIKGRFFAFLTS